VLVNMVYDRDGGGEQWQLQQERCVEEDCMCNPSLPTLLIAS